MNAAAARTFRQLERGLLDGVLTRTSPQRALLLVEGRDARTFLNGLVTQQLDDPSQRGTHACHSTGILTVKGRLLCDALVYERPAVRDFLLDVDARVVDALRAHLERYKLRAQVRIDSDVTRAYTLYTLVAANVDARDRLLRNLLNRGDLGHALGLYVDPRWELCLRLYAPRDAALPLEGVSVHVAQSMELYSYLRVLHSVYEGASELPSEKAMPLEAQLQHNAGVNFHKGCYLGQELVARTFHKGELHKALFTLRCTAPGLTPARTWQTQRNELFPAHFLDDALIVDTQAPNSPAQGSDATLLTESGARTGKVFARVLDLAVAHVRFEHLPTPLTEFTLAEHAGDEADARLRPERWRIVYPPWWDHSAAKEES